MELLKCHWLGSPRIEYRGRAVKLEARKAAALLAYLSLTPGECQREVLATMHRPLASLNPSLPACIEADHATIAVKHNLSDSPTFDEWQFFQRDSMRHELQELLQHLSFGCSARGQWDQVILYAGHRVTPDCLHEVICHALMQAGTLGENAPPEGLFRL